VKHLINKFGEDSVLGKNSLLGSLTELGEKIIPTQSFSPQGPLEHPWYNGGYSVQFYSKRVACLQLEIGFNLRNTNQTRKNFAEKLASAIVSFYLQFQSSKET